MCVSIYLLTSDIPQTAVNTPHCWCRKCPENTNGLMLCCHAVHTENITLRVWMTVRTMSFLELFFCVAAMCYSNILKATANDDMSLEAASLTKSQKNFCSSSSSSNNRSPASAQCSSPVLPQRREATEEEAERCEPLLYTRVYCPAALSILWLTFLSALFAKVHSAGEPGSSHHPALVQGPCQEETH